MKKVWSPKFFPFQIFREILRDNPDIVHLQFELNMFGPLYTNFLIPVLILLLKLSGKRTVVTIHGIIPRTWFSPQKIGRILPAGVLRNRMPLSLFKLLMFHLFKMLDGIAFRIVVHSNVFKRWLSAYPVSQDKVHVVPHGCGSLTALNPKSQGKWENLKGRIILNFGIIAPRKGIDTLIEAFARLNLQDVSLVIVGREMPYYAGYLRRLRELVKKHRLESKVIFTGFLPAEEVHYLFDRAVLVVFPYIMTISASGALSYAIQHYKPIIVTDTEFFREELKDAALFVQAGNVEELAEAIRRLLEDEKLRISLSRTLVKKAEEKSWEAVARKMLEVYSI